MPEYTIELIAVGCGDLFSILIPSHQTTMIKETDIPRIYRTGKTKPAKNVAELIELLKVLPPDLKIYHGFGDKVRVTVTKLNGTKLRLSLDEVD